MKIINLSKNDTNSLEQVALLLLKEFTHAWNEFSDALHEVEESLHEDNISIIAISDTGEVMGWIAGKSAYGGNVWELHPLVVKRNYQRKGIGKALVFEFEKSAKEKGGITVYLGTDDENMSTSLSEKDLYPNVLQQLAAIKNLKNHPFEFYEKVGYSIVGVLPDANGYGKPDILMAKRISD